MKISEKLRTNLFYKIKNLEQIFLENENICELQNKSLLKQNNFRKFQKNVF